VRVLEVQAQSEGGTPLKVNAGQRVMVRVAYSALDEPGTFNGTLVIHSDAWADQQVSLALTLGGVKTTFPAASLQLTQGQDNEVPIFVRSFGGPVATVRYEVSTLLFDTGLSIVSGPIQVQPLEAKAATLIVRADAATPLGDHEIGIDQVAFNKRSSQLVQVNVVPIPEEVLLAAAREKIVDKYKQIGSERSRLGLPIDPNMGVEWNGISYATQFRGGQIVVMDPLNKSSQAQDLVTNNVSVRWVGLECQIKEEHTGDEIYGCVSCLVPVQLTFPPTAPVISKFPGDGAGTDDMGDDNARIINTGELLYQGAPADIKIICQLIEHDDADVSSIKQAASDAVTKAAQAFSNAASGVDAEKLGAREDFITGFVDSILQSILNALGGKDDVFNPGVLLINSSELQTGNFTRQVLTRSDDPKTISYTHKLIVTGVDDGGDTGVYAFYFDVQKIL
jgi:hypothetical protein